MARKLESLVAVVTLACAVSLAGHTLEAQVVTVPPTSSGRGDSSAERARVREAARRAARRNPSTEDVLGAISQSGLSESQIRARLRQAGHDPSIADPYFAAIASNGGTDAAADDGSAGQPEHSRDPFLAAFEATRRIDLAPPPGWGDDAEAADEPSDTDRRVAVSRRSTAPTGSGLQIFGRDIFLGESGVFDPVVLGPVDDSYRLGVGDQLQLVYMGDVEEAFQLTVRRDGTVIVPNVGQITLAGLTMGGAKALLRLRAGRSYSGVESGTMTVDLTLSRVRTNVVFVVGDVERPGSYQVNALSTIFHALVRAGGPTTRGSLRRIQLRRGGAVVKEIDLYDYVLRGDATNDVRAESGDIIFVPLNQRAIAMTGAVRRPAIFELKENERLGDLLRYAGGLLPSAATERFQIDRILPSEQRAPGVERVTTDVRIPNGRADAVEGTDLRDHDIVFAYSIGDLRRNSVEISGQVQQPGTYEIEDRMTLSTLVARAQGFMPYALPDRVKLFRPIAATGRVEQVSLDFSADSSFEVREFDHVEILDARVGYPSGRVTLTGAVRTPGSRGFIENQTVADALHLAGGLREDAIEIEVATRRLGLSYSDTLVHTRVLRLEAPGAIPSESHAITLRPDDQIHVRSSPGYRDPQMVEVKGLFSSPGMYPLRQEGELLRDVISRAGGALPNAFPATFRIIRDSVPIVVEYARMLRGDRAHNVRLRGADQIMIGPDPGTVAVAGAVVRPAVFPYVRGWSMGDYLKAAGGVTRQGDGGRTSVEYASGATATTRRMGGGLSRPRMESGAVIRVPEKEAGTILERGTRTLTSMTSQASSAIMAVLGARVLLGQ